VLRLSKRVRRKKILEKEDKAFHLGSGSGRCVYKEGGPWP
jgi:hypothetical protein